jgi:hypothetical protein
VEKSTDISKEEVKTKEKHMSVDYKVKNIKKNIQRILQEAGVYTGMLTYQVEITAGDLLLYRKIRAEALDPNTPVYLIEISREGFKRKNINPIFSAMTNASNSVTKDFEKLTMNIKDDKKKAVASNALTALMDKFNNPEYND